MKRKVKIRDERNISRTACVSNEYLSFILSTLPNNKMFDISLLQSQDLILCY